ncbi:hypothetical protein CC2G_008835 [Coprinopsis cinerea AmutBmut pab1-1]|nr:hypothetical protein CC2G_008835 [Coprinopsis cinerea AmutBmut pab1-1]
MTVHDAPNERALLKPASHARSSLLFELPSELITKIFELALLGSKPSDLSALSKTIHNYVNDILYRVVVLDSAHSIRLFHRTARSNQQVLSYVKKLVITWQSDSAYLNLSKEIRGIIAECTQIHTLEIPILEPEAMADFHWHPNLIEITTRYMEADIGQFQGKLKSLWDKLTHLRLAEPAEFGMEATCGCIGGIRQSASTRISPALAPGKREPGERSYLRRRRTEYPAGRRIPFFEGADCVSHREGNDTWKPEPVRESNIWEMLEEVARQDKRLVLVEGKYGEWATGWKDFRPIDGGMASEFWKEYGVKTVYS